MTINDILLDLKIYHDAFAFIPERWQGEAPLEERFFVPFGKGK